MATTNEVQDLRQNIDLLVVNVEQEILPSLSRVEATQGDHGQVLRQMADVLSSMAASIHRIEQHLGITPSFPTLPS